MGFGGSAAVLSEHKELFVTPPPTPSPRGGLARKARHRERSMEPVSSSLVRTARGPPCSVN